jgi:hypothetical protein
MFEFSKKIVVGVVVMLPSEFNVGAASWFLIALFTQSMHISSVEVGKWKGLARLLHYKSFPSSLTRC